VRPRLIEMRLADPTSAAVALIHDKSIHPFSTNTSRNAAALSSSGERSNRASSECSKFIALVSEEHAKLLSHEALIDRCGGDLAAELAPPLDAPEDAERLGEGGRCRLVQELSEASPNRS
jgi:hypothetical protein